MKISKVIIFSILFSILCASFIFASDETGVGPKGKDVPNVDPGINPQLNPSPPDPSPKKNTNE